jgi:hypothetical protein
MKTIEIKLYQLNELNTEAYTNAIDSLNDINVSHDWYAYHLDEAKELGLTIDTFDIHHSMSASGNFTLSANEVAQNILNSHGEQCNTYKTALNFMNKWQPIFNKYMQEEGEELETELLELEDIFLNDLLTDYVDIMDKDYEYLTSDEAVVETIEANDYHFTEKGELY